MLEFIATVGHVCRNHLIFANYKKAYGCVAVTMQLNDGLDKSDHQGCVRLQPSSNSSFDPSSVSSSLSSPPWPGPADRQPCGYKSTYQRGAIACPWYQSLQNRVGYFGGTGEILGLGFGSFFFVFCCLFCVCCGSRLFVCTFWLHNLVLK
jgi:hypothetical protein